MWLASPCARGVDQASGSPLASSPSTIRPPSSRAIEVDAARPRGAPVLARAGPRAGQARRSRPQIARDRRSRHAVTLVFVFGPVIPGRRRVIPRRRRLIRRPGAGRAARSWPGRLRRRGAGGYRGAVARGGRGRGGCGLAPRWRRSLAPAVPFGPFGLLWLAAPRAPPAAGPPAPPVVADPEPPGPPGPPGPGPPGPGPPAPGPADPREPPGPPPGGLAVALTCGDMPNICWSTSPSSRSWPLFANPLASPSRANSTVSTPSVRDSTVALVSRIQATFRSRRTASSTSGHRSRSCAASASPPPGAGVAAAGRRGRGRQVPTRPRWWQPWRRSPTPRRRTRSGPRAAPGARWPGRGQQNVRLATQKTQQPDSRSPDPRSPGRLRPGLGGRGGVRRPVGPGRSRARRRARRSGTQRPGAQRAEPVQPPFQPLQPGGAGLLAGAGSRAAAPARTSAPAAAAARWSRASGRARR